jgi:hypothetical protein
MEIIESFQASENLANRTFRGRSLGCQDECEPEVDVAERSNARMRRTVPWSQAVIIHPAAIGVQHDVRIVRTLEACLLWPNRYRTGASQRTVMKGHQPT